MFSCTFLLRSTSNYRYITVHTQHGHGTLKSAIGAPMPSTKFGAGPVTEARSRMSHSAVDPAAPPGAPQSLELSRCVAQGSDWSIGAGPWVWR